MKTVHPAFDPVTRSWFVEEPKAEAKTLARLQRLLPGYELIGYEPNGYTAPPWPTMRDAERAVMPLLSTKKKVALPPPGEVHSPEFKDNVSRDDKPRKAYGHRKGADRKYDHDAVLNLWAEGLTAKAIAERLGMRMPSVTGIVIDYRKRHDPRAATRYYK